MSVPASATYSAAAIVAANTSFRDLLDAATGAASVAIRDAADVLLSVIPLTDPCGTVNASSGQLTLVPDGRDEAADASGTAAYTEIRDGAGVVHLSMPCEAGISAVSGKCVLSTLAVIAGNPVEIVSATIS